MSLSLILASLTLLHSAQGCCLFVRSNDVQVVLHPQAHCVPTSGNPWAYGQCCRYDAQGNARCAFRQLHTEYKLPDWRTIPATMYDPLTTCFTVPQKSGCVYILKDEKGGQVIHSIAWAECYTVSGGLSYKWQICCDARFQSLGSPWYHGCLTSPLKNKEGEAIGPDPPSIKQILYFAIMKSV